jgi:hypothetical protein
MDESLLQPMLFMMMSSSKNDNNKDNLLLPFFIIVLPIIMKIIHFYEIPYHLGKFLRKTNNDISITISSHEVPVVKGYSNTSFTKLIYSKTFLSLVHYLSNNKECIIESLTEILTNNTELNVRYNDDDESRKPDQYAFIPINNKKILINYCETTINCEFNTVDNKKEESEEKNKNFSNVSTKKNFVIILSIKKDTNNNIELLKKFIDKCICDYDFFIAEKDKKNDNKQYIYEYKNSEKSESSLTLFFDEFPMEHNKDLDINIFFEDKDKLINYIKPFVYDKNEITNKGEEEYKRSGFTFKAGLLFYGAPGCGKTSTIKAILSYTKRHGIIINLNNVKTCEELQNIFRKRNFNRKELNGKQLCFILEDCDAFGDNIIKSRAIKPNEDETKKSFDPNDISQFAKFMDFSNTSNPRMMPNNDTVNLSCFLNILDGIIELHGIMIIMTTNYPEKIDTALIRPGRFDFKYEFKKASKKIIKEMLKFKYELNDEEINKYIEHLIIKDEILSPAEVQSLCFKNKNIEDCIQEIVMACQNKK